MHHLTFTDEEMLKRLKSGGPEAFRALAHMKKLVAKREIELLLAGRARGLSWIYLGLCLGKSPQAVQQRWKRLTGGDEEVETFYVLSARPFFTGTPAPDGVELE